MYTETPSHASALYIYPCTHKTTSNTWPTVCVLLPRPPPRPQMSPTQHMLSVINTQDASKITLHHNTCVYMPRLTCRIGHVSLDWLIDFFFRAQNQPLHFFLDSIIKNTRNKRLAEGGEGARGLLQGLEKKSQKGKIWEKKKKKRPRRAKAESSQDTTTKRRIQKKHHATTPSCYLAIRSNARRISTSPLIRIHKTERAGSSTENGSHGGYVHACMTAQESSKNKYKHIEH